MQANNINFIAIMTYVWECNEINYFDKVQKPILKSITTKMQW
jgi:hypothetical protein